MYYIEVYGIFIQYRNSNVSLMYSVVFADMWQWLMTDVTTVAKDVLELSQSRPEKQVYMSLPRPGVRKCLTETDY